ncbi:MAG: UDP-N-acetylmuramate:L-alanyl-gamma-D-glutamyl-me so-diaminopimelate ligase [Methylohalobius crimeensis]
MHIHILGICGTFMGGLALLAREMGFHVTGSDRNVYPPMSTQLEAQAIQLHHYDPTNLDTNPDLVIIGNALSRGNAELEAVLDRGIPYTSGPQWLAETVLRDRWVLGVAGTHGKTTTASMLAWILEAAGKSPGYLIGGIPQNFGRSACLGNAPFFVVEADEYDTAFFDKRSKFVHYRPRTAILNNLEFDHADIFPDLAAIQTQFHHLVRTVPGNGRIIVAAGDANMAQVLDRGCWTPVEHFGLIENNDWHARLLAEDGSRFQIYRGKESIAPVDWPLSGRHNVSNALAAVAAAHHAGIDPSAAAAALNRFESVKRRLELRGEVAGVSVYDDFAHHPTAIATTLQGLRARIRDQRLIAILEPRSNTMRLGVHLHTLVSSLSTADMAFVYAPPDLGWNAETLTTERPALKVFHHLDDLLDALLKLARPGDHWLFMSNGGFGDIHSRALRALANLPDSQRV